MRPLDAVEAIGPAWQHTRQLVLAPRRWGHLLKLGALALFAGGGGGGGGSSNFNTPGLPQGGKGLPAALPPHLLVVFAAIATVLFVLGLIFFYLSSRLQLVLFEVIATRQTRIRTIWQRYGGIVWRWIGLKLLVLLLAAVCSAPILVPAIWSFLRHLRGAGSGIGPQQSAGFVGAILGFVASVFLLALLISVALTLLRDFGLPSMALEGSSMGESVRRVVQLVRTDPVQVLLYLLLKLLLTIAGAIASFVAIGMVALVLLLPLGGAAYALWVALHRGGGGLPVLMIAGWVVLGLVFLGALTVVSAMTLGLVLFFTESYAVFFLAGRYPLLGNILAPPRPPLASNPPPLGATPA